jgi:hypothetical protein
MVGHLAIAAVDLRIVERCLAHPAFEIVRHDQLRGAAEKVEHAHMRADPVRQLLRPGRLRIGQVGSAEHADENLGFVDFARARIGNADLLAGIIDENLFARLMALAHGRR